jgi:hypothetical protein
MKKIIILSLFILTIISCEIVEYKDLKSSKLELRQLVKTTETTKSSQGYFFLIAGSYNSKETIKTTVKVFAKVEGRYRIIEMPINKIRIVIDNTLKKPYIQVEYNDNKVENDEWILECYHNINYYVVYCPEQYLPEKLLPIEL